MNVVKEGWPDSKAKVPLCIREYWPYRDELSKQTSQQREPMMSCPIPQLPWQAVASDCFKLEGEHCAVLVDLYSDFIEIVCLLDMSTKTLIQQMKPILATHGTPALLITDNGTNYSSQEFKEFTQAWDINHITTSHHHPKSNGKAESAVKIIKGIISKAKKEGMDM